MRLTPAQVRTNLWDLAGSEDYLEVRNEFYKDAQGCVLVYDATNRASFEALPRWLEESEAFGAQNMVRGAAACGAAACGALCALHEG